MAELRLWSPNQSLPKRIVRGIHVKPVEPSCCGCQIIKFYNIHRSKQSHLKACIVFPSSTRVQEMLDSWVGPAIYALEMTLAIQLV